MIDVVTTHVASPSNFHLVFDIKSASDCLAELTDEMSTRYNSSQETWKELKPEEDFPLEGKVLACAYHPNTGDRQKPTWVRAMVQCAIGIEGGFLYCLVLRMYSYKLIDPSEGRDFLCTRPRLSKTLTAPVL